MKQTRFLLIRTFIQLYIQARNYDKSIKLTDTFHIQNSIKEVEKYLITVVNKLYNNFFISENILTN